MLKTEEKTTTIADLQKKISKLERQIESKNLIADIEQLTQEAMTDEDKIQAKLQRETGRSPLINTASQTDEKNSCEEQLDYRRR